MLVNCQRGGNTPLSSDTLKIIYIGLYSLYRIPVIAMENGPPGYTELIWQLKLTY